MERLTKKISIFYRLKKYLIIILIYALFSVNLLFANTDSKANTSLSLNQLSQSQLKEIQKLKDDINEIKKKINNPPHYHSVTIGKIDNNYIINAQEQNRSLNLLQWISDSQIQVPYFILGGEINVQSSFGYHTNKQTMQLNDGYDNKTNNNSIYLNDAKFAFLTNLSDIAHIQGQFGLLNPGDTDLSLEDMALFFGNLKQSPFYVDIGQTYVNFGLYNENWLITDNLAKGLFFTSSLPQALVGIYTHGFNLTISAYQRNQMPENNQLASSNSYAPKTPALALQAFYQLPINNWSYALFNFSYSNFISK